MAIGKRDVGLKLYNEQDNPVWEEEVFLMTALNP